MVVELFKDVAFASAPLTPQRAQLLIESVRSSQLLRGWRGGPNYDEGALCDALCRVSEFAVAHAHELDSIHINPFVVRESDATDNHGPYKGSATGFIDWAVEKLKDSGRLVHMLGNISIVLRGPAAAVESYFQAFQADKTASGEVRETFLCGRYIDRFEKRGDEWRVAQRVVTYDWISVNERANGTDAERFGVRQPVGGPKPDDPYYVTHCWRKRLFRTDIKDGRKFILADRIRDQAAACATHFIVEEAQFLIR
ncbi:MAG: acetate--CoA ligase family protein [Pseudomonadota bacterium]